MPVSNSRDLLGQLSNLEKSFHEFSFEELTVNDAKALKEMFTEFRKNLENQIFPSKAEERPLIPKNTVIPKAKVEAPGENQNTNMAQVSHELRTPLNSIIGFTHSLQEESLTPSQQKKVQAIQMASSALLNIIKELLEYSKLSADAKVVQKVDFKLRSFIQDMVFLCETLVIDGNIKISTTIGKEVPEYIIGDPSKLSQVLLNLIGNSIKFVPKGEIRLNIDVKVKSKDACVLEFKVEDNGIGIPKDRLSGIFEGYSYLQSEAFQNYGGRGLGLPITKEIIEKQNGTIGIHSVEGQGTLVHFEIPFGIGSSKKESFQSTQNRAVPRGKELLKGMSILVFEDNLMHQQLLQEQLGKLGCKVYTQVGLTKGLSILASNTIDVVLMDVKIPNLDGYEITKAIRSHNNRKINQVPIIAFSTAFSANDKQKYANLKINDLLLKPYTLDELILKLVKYKKRAPMTPNQNELLRKKMIEPKETTVLDLENLLNECFEEVDMLKELVQLLKNNVMEFVGSVKVSLKVNDMKSIALSAHKLKAGMAMIKAEGMRNLIVSLEAQAKNERPFEVNELFESFLVDYPLLEHNIDKELERIIKSR